MTKQKGPTVAQAAPSGVKAGATKWRGDWRLTVVSIEAEVEGTQRYPEGTLKAVDQALIALHHDHAAGKPPSRCVCCDRLVGFTTNQHGKPSEAVAYVAVIERRMTAGVYQLAAAMCSACKQRPGVEIEDAMLKMTSEAGEWKCGDRSFGSNVFEAQKRFQQEKPRP